MLGCRPERTLVAQGPVCQVEECSCGTLHLTIGALTIRLGTEVVASMRDTLADALVALSDPSHGESHQVPS